MKNQYFSRGLMGLLLVTVVLIMGYLTFSKNIDPVLSASEAAHTPVLSKSLPAGELAAYLVEQGYMEDPADAACASAWITEHIGSKPMKNLGALNKDPFRIPVSVVDSAAGPHLRLRSDASRFDLGQNDEFRNLPDESLTSTFSCTGGAKGYSIPVFIREENPAYKDMDGFKGRILKRIYRTFKRDFYLPVGGVLIRISEHNDENRNGVTIGYMRTDASGNAVFEGLQGHFYSLLPIQADYEFGTSIGTRGMKNGLDHDFKKMVRTRREHTIRLFDSYAYGRIKEDRGLSVRSADTYRNALFSGFAVFLAAWWAFYLLMGLLSVRRKRSPDYLIPLILMTLTGIDLLCMYSIADPLTDSLLGKDMVTGVVVGLIAMAGVSLVDWGAFFYRGAGNIDFDFTLQAVRFLEKPFFEKVASFQDYTQEHMSDRFLVRLGLYARYYLLLIFSVVLLPVEWLLRLIAYFPRKWNFELPQGAGYLLLVLLFIFLLALFGDGPEGSGTKVNLFFFQPSELNKYLVVFFMAVFFAANSSRIQTFSEELTPASVKMQIRTVAFIVLAIGFLLLLYMEVMSDMGPALVIIVTFILLYSIARRDVRQLLLGIVSYLVLVHVVRLLPFGGSWIVQTIVFALWLALWILGWNASKKRLYESAIFFNVVLFAFLCGGQLLLKLGKEEGQRLVDRQKVAESIWNNDVTGGGEQVVQGIWSLATGGMAGQGLGKGNPNLVPAFNTDMIFTSIGEEMGFLVLLLLIACMAILLLRSLIIAYKSRDSFLLFLGAGITLVTGVQFFVIVLGSLGIIPLTGVAVPFLSYGMTSMILNLAGMGIILSISSQRVDRRLTDENAGYAKTLKETSVYGFVGLTVIVLCFLLNYQFFRRDHYLIKPAYVCNEEGVRLQEYNPRIGRLLRKLESGNIYDRNGLLLATSSRDDLDQAGEKIGTTFSGNQVRARLMNQVQRLKRQSHRRYYPFGSDLFFMLGDLNTMTLWGTYDNNPHGYFAEERHQVELLGFQTASRDDDNKFVVKEFDAKKSVSPFLPSIDTTYNFIVRDYSNRHLLRMLRQGTDGREFRRWNDKRPKRDIYLTLDARLQTVMQDAMSTYVPDLQRDVTESLHENYHPGRGRAMPSQKLRASVVVLDVSTGDLLTSAVWPLPDQDTIRTLLRMKKDYLLYEQEPTALPFTDRDLGLTFQTQPGSTAKVMSSMAAFMKLGNDAVGNSTVYKVSGTQAIHDKAGTYTLETGLVNSINAYFVNLVNDHDLYPMLDSVYRIVGHRIGDDLATPKPLIQKSYFFDRKEFLPQQKVVYGQIVEAVRARATTRYAEYKRTRSQEKMNYGDWGWAWGQGTLDASPLGMARVVSIVAGGGVFHPTRYVLARGTVREKAEAEKLADSVRVFNRNNSLTLQQFMREETDTRRTGNRPLPHTMGGKTGTPERSIKFLDDFGDADRFNDAWYICFVDVVPPACDLAASSGRRKIAIAVRLERTYKFQSGKAADFVSAVVVPSLRNAGYRVIDN